MNVECELDWRRSCSSSERGEALEGGTLPFRDMHRNFQRTSLPPISIRLVETQFGQKSKLKSHPFSIDLQNISENAHSLGF